MSYLFDVALSYTSAELEFATRLDADLRARGLSVFFDRNQVEALVGQDGADALRTLYQRRARLCVLLLSPAYEQSAWTQIEREAVMARRQTDRDAFLIPVLVRGECPSWLPRQLIYLDLERYSQQDVLNAITERAHQPRWIKALDA